MTDDSTAFKIVCGRGRNLEEWNDNDEWVCEGEGTLYEARQQAKDAASTLDSFDDEPVRIIKLEAVTDKYGNQVWQEVDDDDNDDD